MRLLGEKGENIGYDESIFNMQAMYWISLVAALRYVVHLTMVSYVDSKKCVIE